MHTRNIRILLWSLTGLAAAIALGAITAAILLPYPTGNVLPPSSIESVGVHSASTQSIPPLSAFDSVARLDLRRPLVDSPPPAKVTAVASNPPPALSIKLVGTVVQPGHSRALLLLPDGKIEMKRVGEITASAQILEITKSTVTVSYLGSDVTLKLEKPEKS